MQDWLAAIAALAASAMNGTPMVWSSLPIVLTVWVAGGLLRRRRRFGFVSGYMRAVSAAVMVAVYWGVLVTILEGDPDRAVALLGGWAMLVVGFRIGCATSGQARTVRRVLMATAIGYSVHALRLLEWFVSLGGWSLSDLVLLRWDLRVALESSVVGFGNLGNNAVLAGMLLPAFTLVAIRGSGVWGMTVAGTAAVLGFAVLGITQARAPMLIVIVITMALLTSARVMWAVVTLLVALSLLLASPQSVGAALETNAAARIAQTFSELDQDASIGDRADSIQEGWDLALTSPVMGVGVAQLPRALTHTAPHQWHLHQMLEWGSLVALASVMATIALLTQFVGALRRCWCSDGAAMEEAICLSVPVAYLSIGSVSGAQWHYGLASAWPVLCGLYFGVAWARLAVGSVGAGSPKDCPEAPRRTDDELTRMRGVWK